MLIEEVELTLSHVGLGPLGETALMKLFATVQAHRLVQGVGATLRDVVDAAGLPLYPAFYWTLLTVPDSAPLEGFRLWDRVEVGTEIHSFGGMMLESLSLLGRPGELTKGHDPASVPSMRSGTLFILDAPGKAAQASAPRAGTIAALPKLASPPASMARFRLLLETGRWEGAPVGPLLPLSPLVYEVQAGRDTSPGHGVLFATFVDIMDRVEAALLRQHLPADAEPFTLAPRERETFYLANCVAGDVLSAEISSTLARGARPGEAEWECAVALRRGAGELLAISRSRKRLVSAHGGSLSQGFEHLIGVGSGPSRQERRDGHK